MVEINSFANPYPSQKCTISSFLTDFIHLTGNDEIIEQYDMQPFPVVVLDKRRTLAEKLVSLLRCSLASQTVPQLSAKIRHFYDLYFLLRDPDVKAYLQTDVFRSDFKKPFLA